MQNLKEVKEAFEEIAKVFTESRQEPWKEILTLIEHSQGPVLDAGCGCGANAVYIAKISKQNYVGLDITINMLKKLRQIIDVDTVAGDLTRLPFRDSSFRVVTCIATLHHVAAREERIRAIKEIVRVLKKGGQALITVWSRSVIKNLRDYIDKGEIVLIPWSWRLNKKIYRVYHLYTDKELIEEVDEATHRIKIVVYGRYIRKRFENYITLLQKI